MPMMLRTNLISRIKQWAAQPHATKILLHPNDEKDFRKLIKDGYEREIKEACGKLSIEWMTST